MAVVGGVLIYFSVQLEPKPSLTTTMTRNAKEPQNNWVVTSSLHFYLFSDVSRKSNNGIVFLKSTECACVVVQLSVAEFCKEQSAHALVCSC